ncbi:hypothetical protein LXL04_002848 [Taraxacum kok-saghyz]
MFLAIEERFEELLEADVLVLTKRAGAHSVRAGAHLVMGSSPPRNMQIFLQKGLLSLLFLDFRSSLNVRSRPPVLTMRDKEVQYLLHMRNNIWLIGNKKVQEEVLIKSNPLHHQFHDHIWHSQSRYRFTGFRIDRQIQKPKADDAASDLTLLIKIDFDFQRDATSETIERRSINKYK